MANILPYLATDIAVKAFIAAAEMPSADRFQYEAKVTTAGVVTFATVGGNPVVILAGSKISFIAPASADITAAGITISIAGLA